NHENIYLVHHMDVNGRQLQVDISNMLSLKVIFKILMPLTEKRTNVLMTTRENSAYDAFCIISFYLLVLPLYCGDTPAYHASKTLTLHEKIHA
ncbi:hypothetical protein L9F63_016985, partial [Diploptera punctata]